MTLSVVRFVASCSTILSTYVVLIGFAKSVSKSTSGSIKKNHVPTVEAISTLSETSELITV
jgi:hypothetical protein